MWERIDDVFSDEILTISTKDKKYNFNIGDTISITMIDGFIVSGRIEQILGDSIQINSNNTLMKYYFEKFAYIKNIVIS